MGWPRTFNAGKAFTAERAEHAESNLCFARDMDINLSVLSVLRVLSGEFSLLTNKHDR
jgi:hypothetical protein